MNANNPEVALDQSIVADSLTSIEDIYVAPEGENLNNGERQQLEVSDSIAGANVIGEDDFPAWDGGGYRGRPEPTVRGGVGGGKPKPGTSTNPPKTVKDDKKNVKTTKN